MRRFVGRFETRELLLVAFFAAFLVASRAALRWHLNLPGHSMLPAAFGLVLLRICVERRGAALLCGTLAGLAIAALGLGKGGPLLVLKLALPGAAVELGGGFLSALDPRAAGRLRAGGLAVGMAAGASAIVPVVVVEWLADVDATVIALHAATSGAGRIAFGGLGGLAAAWVGGELVHHGLLVRSAPADAERPSEREGVLTGGGDARAAATPTDASRSPGPKNPEPNR